MNFTATYDNPALVSRAQALKPTGMTLSCVARGEKIRKNIAV